MLELERNRISQVRAAPAGLCISKDDDLGTCKQCNSPAHRNRPLRRKALDRLLPRAFDHWLSNRKSKSSQRVSTANMGLRRSPNSDRDTSAYRAHDRGRVVDRERDVDPDCGVDPYRGVAQRRSLPGNNRAAATVNMQETPPPRNESSIGRQSSAFGQSALCCRFSP